MVGQKTNKRTGRRFNLKLRLARQRNRRVGVRNEYESSELVNAEEFNESTYKYKANPTIEAYVSMRRTQPDTLIEISNTNGLDFLLEDEKPFRDIGIEPAAFASALDANPESQSEISLVLLERLIDRKRIAKGGQAHAISRKISISDVTVNYLIGCLLDALSWTDNLLISRELIVLIKHQLGVDDSDIRSELSRAANISRAKFAAAALIDKEEKVTLRKVAKLIGVQPSTVMRWFPDNDLELQGRIYSTALKSIKQSVAHAKLNSRNENNK